MSFKKWFYRGGTQRDTQRGTQKRVAPTPDLDTAALQAQSRRKAGESLGGWDSEWHAAL